jgi:glutamine cyclotransferase
MASTHCLSLIFLFAAGAGIACNQPGNAKNDSNSTPGPKSTPLIGFSVVNTYAHDTSYFTEGLEFYKGQLWESSGGNNAESPYPSAAGIVDLSKGKVDSKVTLDAAVYFGEGITIFNEQLYQLTWKNGIGFIYDVKTLKKKREFRIPSPEGWGLTHDSSSLYMSDGSNSIYQVDPVTIQIKNVLRVTDDNGPVGNLNELEYVNGVLYANQWLSPYILRIDAVSGKITGKIDLSRIVNEIGSKQQNTDVLNGIAYHSGKGTFFITGKKWPTIYEIRLQ